MNFPTFKVVYYSYKMQIFVKAATGKTTTLDVEEAETVENVMAKINDKEDIAVDQQKLVYEGKTLEKGKTLKDYGITNEATIHVAVRQKGG